MKHLWPWLLAALSGAMLACAFPPLEQATLAWFALTPVIAALWFGAGEGRWRPLRLFGLGYVFGLAFFWGSLLWLTEVTVAGWFTFALYLALFPGVWGLFVGIACRPRESTLIDVPSEWLRSSVNLRLALRGAAAWAGLEWLRSALFTGFGWNALGVSQWQSTPVIQIADFAGVGGVSFVIALVNLILVMTVKRLTLEVGRVRLRPHFDFTLTMALVGLTLAYGVYRVSRHEKGTQVPLSIAAVQANIPQDQKWNAAFEKRILDTYSRLSANAAALRPDLLIWPEAALPRPLFDGGETDKDMEREVAEALGRLQGGDFLFGSVRYFLGQAFNSAVLLDARGGVQVYDKIHLVPFGEYVPFRHSFPLFAWIVGSEVPSDFDAGTEPVVMTLRGKKPFRVAPLICFEDTVGELSRQFAKGGAELLVTLTNDGWFRRSAGSRQHLANAVFRCAETKLPLVRAANTGVTCVVDPFGHVSQILENAKGSTFTEGVLFAKVPITLQPPKTLYTRYGDIFALACLVAAVLSLRAVIFTPRMIESREN
jgi:apolipoprotein N-acyltransferase